MTQDMTRNMTIKKTLMMVLMVTFGTNVSWGQTDYFVLKDGDNHFVKKEGNGLGRAEGFDANSVVWAGAVGGNANSRKYSITEGETAYYITAATGLVGINTSSASSANNEWYGDSPAEMYAIISDANNYVYWDNNAWTLTTNKDGKNCVRVYPVIVEQKSYPTINTANIGTTMTDPVTIDYTDSYIFNIDDLSDISYTVYTFDEEVHNWYDGEDHGNTAPENAAWGEVSGLKKVWTLLGEDHERFASVNASTGVLRVTKLPSVGEATMTLKCTITKPGTELSRVIEKTITLKPEKIDAPTITNSAGNFEISSTQTSGLDIYYTKGSTELTTPEPTTDEPSVKYTEPFAIDGDVNCIKAYAVHTFGQHTAESTVSVYNFVRFTNSEISGLKPTTTVTVAPLVYSLDLKTPDNMEAYIVSRVTTIDHTAVLTKLEYIPAGVPVLLMDNNTTKHTGKTPFFLKSTDDPNDVVLTPIDLEELNSNESTADDITPITDAQKTTNQLRVTEKPMTVQDAQVYMYYNGEFVLTFGGTMKAGRFFLYNPNYDAPETTTPVTPDPAPLHLVIEATTGIEEVRCKMDDGRDDKWYTLDGRQLQGKPTTKGLYINNGNKVVIK